MMMNEKWHRAHRMPKNPTSKQRLAWHGKHAEHCNCRDSKKELAKLKKAV